MGLYEARLGFKPKIPGWLRDIAHIEWKEEAVRTREEIAPLFPCLGAQGQLRGVPGGARREHPPLRIGVVFSGGPASGGHNVVTGIFDAMGPGGVLLGFLNGPEGVVQGHYKQLGASDLAPYRNRGGFDLLGTGRTKIEKEEQLLSVGEVASKLKLDGLVIIGGDDSNTNAAVLAEYLLKQGSPTRVVGVPKTIDGDLKNSCVEISFGFDTACKTYAEIIGNIEADAVSAGKYYHCIKLMGRSASHVALECALVTRPNLAWIGEEVAERRLGLADLVDEMVSLVLERAKRGKHYGVMLIPEGIIECIPEMGALIEEINTLLGKAQEVEGNLSKRARETWGLLPAEMQQQLLSHRDPHGNVHVSSIETEKLFLTLVKERVQISAVHHFLGYEGRSGFPSQFDCNYCYALGHVAALLVARGKTGYMACVQHLTAPSDQWKIAAVPLPSLMHLEKRRGVLKPVIAKALVGKEDPAFLHFQKERASWRLEDHYHNPGPIQFGGDPALCDSVPLSVRLNA